MKKLMIAAAMVCAAAFAQAATVTWSMSNAYQPGSTTAKLNGTIVCLIDNSVSLTALDEAIQGGTFATVDAQTKEVTYMNGVIGYGKVNNGSMLPAQSGNWGSYSQGDSVTGYLVIFDKATVADSTVYTTTGTKTANFTADTGSKPLAFASVQTLTQDADNWTSIAPEPTTGLLMLFGLAGLALKRKRA